MARDWVPKRDLVNTAIICTFCGTDRDDTPSSCESCGANSIEPKAQNKKERTTTDGFVRAFSLVLKDAQKSRLYLTGTTLLFAVLFGVFWQKSQSVPITATKSAQLSSYSEHALALASIPEAVGVFEKKAMFASAMMDVSVLNVMVIDHYADTGKLPASLLDLNLEQDSMTSRNVEALNIEDAGVISIKLTQGIGKNMHVKLVPELIMGGSNLQWNCFSNLPSAVLAGTHCESI